MAEQHTLEGGNAIMVLTGMNEPFRDGHTTGYPEFYDERHRPSFPLTSQVISDYLTMIVNEPSILPPLESGTSHRLDRGSHREHPAYRYSGERKD